MKATTNLDDVITAIRTVLITQSELAGDRVLNALSLTGTELDQLLEENAQIYNSIEQQNTTLLFELSDFDSSSNVSIEEIDNEINGPITCYTTKRVMLNMYGSSSSDLAIKLASRLRSESVRTELYSSGIQVISVSTPQTINEFKNDIMWTRNVFTINIGIKYNISKVTSSTEYMKLNTIMIKEEQ